MSENLKFTITTYENYQPHSCHTGSSHVMIERGKLKKIEYVKIQLSNENKMNKKIN